MSRRSSLADAQPVRLHQCIAKPIMTDPKKMQQSFWNHLMMAQRWPLVVSALLILALAGAVRGWHGIDAIGDVWADKFDPLISLATLLVAVLVWWGEARQDWIASLPCKLTAVFVHNQRTLMICELADLASEADIRAMGQQLGRTMNGGQDLKLALPAFRKSGGMPEVGENGEIYRHYTIRFQLLEAPAIAATLAPGEAWVWRPPFDSLPAGPEKIA